MFSDTGLEYPEVRDFVKTIPNCEMIKPKLTFRQVIEKYGYPIISKDQSNHLYSYRVTKSEYTKNTLINGNKSGMGNIAKKWFFLTDAPFLISDQCCGALKKQPAHQYEKKSGRHPMLGIMASR